MAPAAAIVVEEPFGRTRAEMLPLVDYMVLIELPAAVAMARRLARSFFPEGWREQDLEERFAELELWLRAYPTGDHRIYEGVLTYCRKAADLVVDGMAPAEALARGIVVALQARFPHLAEEAQQKVCCQAAAPSANRITS